MQQWRYRRVTSESLGCNLWLSWGGEALPHTCSVCPMVSTVWHAVLDLTGMRGVTYPRSLASQQWALTFASRSLWMRVTRRLMCLLLRGWWWLILTVDTWDAVHFEARAKSSWLHTRSWLSPRASGIQQCAFLLTMSPRLSMQGTLWDCLHVSALQRLLITPMPWLRMQWTGLEDLHEEVQAKIGMKLNTNNTIWSWAARHA